MQRHANAPPARSGYVNIRRAGHERVLREAGFDFDVFLSQKLWRTYVVDKDRSEQDTRIWDVLFMARTGCPVQQPQCAVHALTRYGSKAKK